MAFYINPEECTACGDCEPVCPTSSIYSEKGMFKITKNTCTECENDFDVPQCIDVCTVDNCILPL